jgi:hypothetical protein
VEIYEAERRIQKKGTSSAGSSGGGGGGNISKFSLRKLFKSQQQFSGSRSDSPADSGNSTSSALQLLAPNKFIDKEHEREILERQGKGRPRPEIIHPLDLQNGGVEVVKITPKAHALKNGIQAPAADRKTELNMLSSNDKLNNTIGISNSNNKLVVKLGGEEGSAIIMQSALDMENNKDSGHDSSSIQTEGSEETAGSGGEYFSSGGHYSAVRCMQQVRT